MIFAQIHGAGDSPIPLILAAEYHVATPRVRIFKNGPGLDNPVVGITPSTPISYRIRIENSRLKLWVIAGLHTDLPPVTSTAPYDWPVSDFTDDSGWYYKDGAYNKTLITSGSTGEAISKIAFLEVLEPADADPSVASGPLTTTLATPDVALTGAVTDTGALSSSLPRPSSVLTGGVTAAGDLAGVAPLPTGTSTGSVSTPGQVAGTLPRPTAAVTGSLTATGVLAATAPAVLGAIDATGQAAGPLAGIAPAPAAALSGTIRAGGALSGGVGMPSVVFTGDVGVSGVLGATTPVPIASLQMYGVAAGELAAMAPLPLLSLRDLGVEAPDGFLGAGVPRRVSGAHPGSLAHERGLQAGMPRKVVTTGAGLPGATP
jgi:hypothetical protein